MQPKWQVAQNTIFFRWRTPSSLGGRELGILWASLSLKQEIQMGELEPLQQKYSHFSPSKHSLDWLGSEEAPKSIRNYREYDLEQRKPKIGASEQR